MIIFIISAYLFKVRIFHCLFFYAYFRFETFELPLFSLWLHLHLYFIDTIRSKCKKLFVAAIDFGTTYSGYAFSSTSDWSKVLTSNWTGGKVVTLKTPTALLLDANKEIKAFGYEAEDQYIELAREEEHEDYYFFHRFKMILHSEKVSIVMLGNLHI